PIPGPAQFAQAAAGGAASPVVAASSQAPATEAVPVVPALDDGIEQLFLGPPKPDATLRPTLLAKVTLHYAHKHADLDRWLEPTLVVPLAPKGRDEPRWSEATWHRIEQLELSTTPPEGAQMVPLDKASFDKKRWATLHKQLKSHLTRNEAMPVWYCPELSLWSRYGESEADLRARAEQSGRERRDLEMAKLRERYAPKVKKLEERLRKAQQRVERERSQQSKAAFDTAVSIGGTVVGAIFGRSVVGGAKTSLRGAGRTAQQREDVAHAEQDLATIQRELTELDRDFEADAEAIAQAPVAVTVERREVKPRKGDTEILRAALLWVP
ncbi:MAG: hypothetical protein KC731_34395, partial [Myxococcales bacterium]|nr:hypothetical protein [Myxococcales bacterium]